MRPIRRVVAGLGLTVMAAFGPSQVMAAQQAAPGQVLPSFTLKALNPDTAGASYVKTTVFVGPQGSKKAAVISFFATYCEPCKKEMPFLAALQEAYRDAGLQVLFVSIDTEATEIDKAKALAETHGLKFPVLSDRFNIVAKRYQVSELPCVYTADQAGLIQTVHTGYGEDAGQVLLDDVRTILGVSSDVPLPSSLSSFFNPPVVEAPKVVAKPPARGKKKRKKKKTRARRKK